MFRIFKKQTDKNDTGLGMLKSPDKNAKLTPDALILGEGVYVRPEGNTLPGNTLVVGAPRSGKGRNYIMPNILQFNSNYVVIDLRGELVHKFGGILKESGYDVKIVDFQNRPFQTVYPNGTTRSLQVSSYNPFAYVSDDDDIRMIADALMPKVQEGDHKGDPFWTEAYHLLLLSSIGYVNDMCNDNDKNLAYVNEVIHLSHAKDVDAVFSEEFTAMMNEYCTKYPENIGAKSFVELSKIVTSKTSHTVSMSLAVELAYLNLPDRFKEPIFKKADTLSLKSFRSKKTALFIVVDCCDGLLENIDTLLVSQAFKVFASCDKPVEPVHFMLDEYSSLKIHDIEPMLAVSCNYNVTFSILVQTILQLGDIRDVIIGSCRNILWFGGSCVTSAEFLSRSVGVLHLPRYADQVPWKAIQSHQREIERLAHPVTPEELLRMPTSNAVVIRSGEEPVYCKKYVPEKHPNYVKEI